MNNEGFGKDLDLNTLHESVKNASKPTDLNRFTFDQYIANPSGGRSRFVGEIEAARNTYNQKYEKMLLRVAGHINYLLYKSNNGRRYVIYIQMPSESTKGLVYDVVIEFTTKDDVKVKMNHLKEYHVRFFSNDPNFIFTYAFIFNRKKLIIPELVSKLGKVVLKQPPHVTNPNKIVGYVKSFYFAYLFMLNKGLFNKLMWINAGTESQMKNIFTNVVLTSDRKLRQIHDLGVIAKATAKGAKLTGYSATEKHSIEKAGKEARNYLTHYAKTMKLNKDKVVKSAKMTSKVKRTKYIK